MSHKENQSLMDALNNCAAACNYCAAACLDEQDVKMMARCIKLDIDCAEICSLTAGFVARGSDQTRHLLAVCSDLCNACADECEKHAKHGMEHCRECAEACRKCAEACSEMANA